MIALAAIVPAIFIGYNLTPSSPGGGDIFDASVSCVVRNDCADVAVQAQPTPTPIPAYARIYEPDSPIVPLVVAPPITAEAAFVIEEPCGAVLFELDPHRRYATASLAKIVTAIVAVEHGQLSSPVAITIDGAELSLATDSSVMGLVPGQTLILEELLYGLLVPSGNDAARAIAEHIAGDVGSFVSLMNEKIAKLQLKDTHFSNPDGLDVAGQYTSAFDIMILARYLLQDPLLAEIVSTQNYQPLWDGPRLWSTNPLLYAYDGAIGVKTGRTDLAKESLVGAAEQGGRRLVASVLRSDDMYADVSSLLDWAFASVPAVCPAEAITPAG